MALLKSLPDDIRVQDLLVAWSRPESSFRHWVAKVSGSERDKYMAVLAHLD